MKVFLKDLKKNLVWLIYTDDGYASIKMASCLWYTKATGNELLEIPSLKPFSPLSQEKHKHVLNCSPLSSQSLTFIATVVGMLLMLHSFVDHSYYFCHNHIITDILFIIINNKTTISSLLSNIISKIMSLMFYIYL